jgi:hypothetical protein
MKFAEYLQKAGACREARAWVGRKDFPTAWRKCKRGDWMLWFAQKAKLCNSRKLTLMKASCSALARPYIRDERSLAALDAAFAYASGKMEERELAEYVDAAFAAATAAAAAAADNTAAAAAADSVFAAVCGVGAAADDAAAAAAAADAADADAARADVLARCADIFREILPTPHFKF